MIRARFYNRESMTRKGSTEVAARKAVFTAGIVEQDSGLVDLSQIILHQLGGIVLEILP